MQRITTVILAVSIAAITVSFLAANSMLPTTFMIAQSNQPPSIYDKSKILGHVTYVVRGPDGNIKSYAQTDNQEQVMGKTCAINAMFSPSTTSLTTGNTTCSLGRVSAFTGFNVIGLFNGTGTLILNGSDTYAKSKINSGFVQSSSKDGLIPTTAGSNQGAPVAGTVSGSAYNSITISSGSIAFTNLSSSGTTIRGSALLNSTSGTPTMFAENTFGSGSVSVGNQDTLTVTWTITLN